MPTETKGEQRYGRSEAETAMDVAHRCSDDTGPSLARILTRTVLAGVEW